MATSQAILAHQDPPARSLTSLNHTPQLYRHYGT